MIEARSIMQVTWKYVVNGQTCMQVINFTNEDEYPAADPVEVMDKTVDIFSDTTQCDVLEKMQALQSNLASYKQCSAQIVYPHRYIKRVKPMITAGISPAPCSAQNVSLVVTKRSVNAARSGVGSFHLGGIADGMYDKGKIVDAQKGQLQALAEALDLPYTTVNPATVWQPCILNMTPIVGSDPPRFKIGGSTIVLECLAHDELRVMRRRTVGQGI